MGSGDNLPGLAAVPEAFISGQNFLSMNLACWGPSPVGTSHVRSCCHCLDHHESLTGFALVSWVTTQMQQARFLETTERSFVNPGAMSEVKAGSSPESRQGPQQKFKGRPTQGPPSAGEGSQEKVYGRRSPTTNESSSQEKAQGR